MTARLAEVEGPPEVGKVTFIENQVDNTTGTILLRATFPNPQRRLWPGQFVNVTLLLHNKPNCLVLPSQAIQPGQQGDLVFVVKQDNTVEPRPVKTGQWSGTDWVIVGGLKAGDKVIVDNLMKARPGAPVAPHAAGGEGPGAGKPAGAPASAPAAKG